MDCLHKIPEEINFHVIAGRSITRIKSLKNSVVFGSYRSKLYYLDVAEIFKSDKYVSESSKGKALTQVISRLVNDLKQKTDDSVCNGGIWEKLPGKPLGVLLNLNVVKKSIIKDEFNEFLKENQLQAVDEKEAFKEYLEMFTYGYLVAKFMANFLKVLESEPLTMAKFKMPIRLSIYGSECVPAMWFIKRGILTQNVHVTYVILDPVLGDWKPTSSREEIPLRVNQQNAAVDFQLEIFGAHSADQVLNASDIANGVVGMQINKIL